MKYPQGTKFIRRGDKQKRVLTVIDYHTTLRFQIKQAERHGLDSITITLPRAKQIARELRDSIKEQAKPVSRLDRIFSSVEKAKFAEY